MQRLSIFAVMAVVASVVGVAAPAAQGQCTYSWKPGDGLPGVNLGIEAMTFWDPDGAGPQPALLVVGGCPVTCHGPRMGKGIRPALRAEAKTKRVMSAFPPA